MDDKRPPAARDAEECIDTTDICAPTSTIDEVDSNDSSDGPVEPPTRELAAFKSFVTWMLSSSIDELTRVHDTLPFQATSDRIRESASGNTEAVLRPRFQNKGDAALARAGAEAELEAIADLLSVARRERGGIREQLLNLHEEREGSREHIMLLESRIVKHLQDRDLAIAEKYTTEKEIAELESWKAANPPPRQTSTLRGLFKRGGGSERRLGSGALYTPREVEKLQKEIADTKLETALAKTELDTHYYRLRQLEKKVAGFKLEIAQASALEDDLKASLGHLQHERRHSLEKFKQVSVFSSTTAVDMRRSRPK